MPQWIKIKLLKRPYYDKNGDLLCRPLLTDSYGIAEIYGGGVVYPEIIKQKEKILERYTDGDIALIKLDITDLEAEEIKIKDKAMKYQASPKIIKDYNHKDFKAERLSDEEAEAMKKDVFVSDSILIL